MSLGKDYLAELDPEVYDSSALELHQRIAILEDQVKSLKKFLDEMTGQQILLPSKTKVKSHYKGVSRDEEELLYLNSLLDTF